MLLTILILSNKSKYVSAVLFLVYVQKTVQPPRGETHHRVEITVHTANVPRAEALNPVASFLWDAMKQPKSAKELTLALTEEFEVTEAQAAKDVQEFLRHLLEQSMIQEVPYDTL